MDQKDRIKQFKQMAEADTDNELGHFSLGKAYLEAKRFGEATEPLKRAIELNPKLSKAFQLLGEAHAGAGDQAMAIEVWTNGVVLADKQGDRLPRDSMAKMLKDCDAPVPDFQSSAASPGGEGVAESSPSGFQCARCSKPSGKLPKPPFKGPLGERIYRSVCNSCWREWIGTGTKVINELRLMLSKPEAQETYAQYMVEFLMIEEG